MPPEIPWLAPRRLEPLVDLGPGLDPQHCGAALARLSADPDVRAVVAKSYRDAPSSFQGKTVLG